MRHNMPTEMVCSQMISFDLNENVRDCFARKGVEMTYSHVNVHMMEK